jgi:hypothetical protein
VSSADYEHRARAREMFAVRREEGLKAELEAGYTPYPDEGEGDLDHPQLEAEADGQLVGNGGV